MAILRTEDGLTYTNLQEIAQELGVLGIQLNHWSVGNSTQVRKLLTKDSLGESEKEVVLQALDKYFVELQRSAGYQTRDLIVIHPQIPNLDAMLGKFEKIHTHADDEVRYIVAGEGIFGFVRPDGSQVELTVQAEEYINVPKGTEHWFYLTNKRRVKAVRYFSATEGWVPEYTGTEIRIRPTAAIA